MSVRKGGFSEQYVNEEGLEARDVSSAECERGAFNGGQSSPGMRSRSVSTECPEVRVAPALQGVSKCPDSTHHWSLRPQRGESRMLVRPKVVTARAMAT